MNHYIDRWRANDHDSLLLGFGLEGVSKKAERNAVMGRALDHLLR
jgi:hypothetical protein